MKMLVITLILMVCLPCFGESVPKHPDPTVKDCLNYINTASGIAAEYSGDPFSRERLQTISNMEDRLVGCANLKNADAKLLYSLFDAEIRLAGVKQVWLAQSH